LMAKSAIINWSWLFGPVEPFGLVPLEAMASGRPVLALALGGARESVRPGQTGELYPDGGVEALVEALRSFRPNDYSPKICRARAAEFAPERFRHNVLSVVERELNASKSEGSSRTLEEQAASGA
jgi:glycosyltransferase involved in cell wall biosynthesis